MTRAADVDVEFVLAKRRIGASWSAIARMAGCAEADLKRHFDPTAKAQATTARPVRRTPRERVEAWMQTEGLDRDHARILSRLWQAGGATVNSTVLAQGVAGGGAARTVCQEARAAGRKRLGLTFAASGFALTPEDLARVRERAGLDAPEARVA